MNLLDLRNLLDIQLYYFPVIGGEEAGSIPSKRNFLGDNKDLILVVGEADEKRGTVGVSIYFVWLLLVGYHDSPL